MAASDVPTPGPGSQDGNPTDSQVNKLPQGWRGLLGLLSRATVWLSALALLLPLGGTTWIWIYAFSTPGSHWSYVGIGSMAAMAAMLTGIFAGFILGVPKLVSSGQLTVPAGTPSPNTNLGEISDWITKLLLGAGLVSLTHLGGPAARLIDDVASGLYDATGHPAGAAGAKVLAGAVLISFTVLGVVEGYVLTSTWYPRKLQQLADSAAAVEQAAQS
jgi:hypothetical protein